MSRPTCETCNVWTGPEVERTKECRRRSPQVVAYTRQISGHTTDTVISTRWPRTQRYDWCGEHAPAKEGGEDA